MLKILITPLMSILLLASCSSSVQLAPSSLDQQMKQFKIQPNSSKIYVVQSDGIMTQHRINFQVFLNGKYASGMSGSTYSVFDVPEGKNNILIVSPENQMHITVNSKNGEHSFIGVGSIGGWSQMRVSNLRVMNQTEGKKAVLESKLSAQIN